MALTRRGTLQVGACVVLLVLLIWLAILSRDAYPAPTVPVLWLSIAGALFAAIASARLLRGLRKPLANPLKHTLSSLAAGVIAGGLLVSLALDTLVWLTATQRHIEWVRYAVTPGWKNCLYGVAFDDPVLHARIRVCGLRWKLPATPVGVLRIAEASGPYGVVLQQVTTGNDPPR
ncbi:hypothetical protein AAHK20_27530 [Trinickia sp. YCB016]